MHVMIDIETWGTLPGSAIRSIGAVAFDLHSGISLDDTFYCNIDEDSCVDAGLTQDLKTITWWEAQSPAAQTLLQQNPLPVAEGLSELYSWFNRVDGQEVWCQGAAFDVVLLEHAMRKLGIPVPWKFWNVRDTRTLYQVADLAYHNEKREGVEHHALHDCQHQVKLVLLSMGKLKVPA